MRAKNSWSGLIALCLLGAVVLASPASAQIQVTSTTPNNTTQGTQNLNVTITGSGFKSGAKAQWYVTGTTNPGGVTVNSTAFNGSGKLTANISVASNANISGYDVAVTNTDGRTGKGTDLFTIQQSAPVGCSTTGTPSGFTLVTALNQVQSSGAAMLPTLVFGEAIRVSPLDLNRDGVVDTLVAFVTSGSSNGSTPGTYIFFLDPNTGLPQANNPVSGAAWTNPLLVLSGVQSRHAAAGDVNGDGVSDFLLASPADTVAYLFVGSVSGSPSYTPSYTAYKIAAPSGSASVWARTGVLGDLDGDGKDEIAIASVPSSSKEKKVPAVYIFKYSGTGVTQWQVIQDPTGSTTSSFAAGINGGAVAIGNVDGNAGNDLAVGSGGLVYIFPAPLSQSKYFSITGPAGFGSGVGIADVNLDGVSDLVVNISASSGSTQVFAGPVHGGASYTNQLLPATGMGNNWALPGFDVGNFQAGAVGIGTPNADNANSCPISIGALQLFTSPFASTEQPSYVFEPPNLVASKAFEFGYSVGLVPGYPFLLIGEHYRDVGSTSAAGQVYVYRKN